MFIWTLLSPFHSLQYVDQPLEGWTMKVERSLISDHPRLWAAVKQEVQRQFTGIERVVPDGPLAELKKVIVWVHLNDPQTPCMAFHPGADYLREHGMEPRMAGNVEIGNAKNFVSWTYEQPWMVMHELAHAYQFRVLPGGENNKEVLRAFRLAMDAHRYDLVRHWDGSMVKAYATTNPMEYFAETTEAYFGTNDFFPFVRGELQTADPDGYSLMVKVWGTPEKRVPQD